MRGSGRDALAGLPFKMHFDKEYGAITLPVSCLVVEVSGDLPTPAGRH
jgi:hypothetical protein